LFLPNAAFLPIPAFEGRGTFGSGPDYFCNEARCSKARRNVETEVIAMLSWVVTFLIVALIAGILGFGGLAGASIEIAKIIFFIAVVLFLVSAVVGLARGRTRV
jgi:uncharacterized membrane protein YtjA (UPF0391 family)